MANPYFTCELEASVDGDTIHAKMHYRRTDGATYFYQDANFPNPTMTIAGETFTDTSFGNEVRNGISVGSVYTTEFTKTVSEGTYEVAFHADSGLRSDFAGDWSTSVQVSSGGAPTGLTISAPYDVRADGATFDVSVTSFGEPPAASGRWIEAGILGQNTWGGQIRSAILVNTSSGAISVDNTSTQSTSLDVQPNTQYYYGAFAYNTATSTYMIAGQFVTTAASPTVATPTITDNSATFAYTIAADGGFYDKTIEYLLDGSLAWSSIATITGGSATTGNFTITGLTPGEHTIVVRARTSVGSAASASVTFRIVGLNSIVSVNGVAKAVTRGLVSVDGSAKEITRLLVSQNGVATEA